MIKVVISMPRRPDMPAAVFRAYFHRIHLPFAVALPGLRHHVPKAPAEPMTVVQVEPETEADATHAVSELWFDDWASLDSAFASEEWSACRSNLRLFGIPDQAQILIHDVSRIGTPVCREV